jgi:hypothetical protein
MASFVSLRVMASSSRGQVTSKEGRMMTWLDFVLSHVLLHFLSSLSFPKAKELCPVGGGGTLAEGVGEHVIGGG